VASWKSTVITSKIGQAKRLSESLLKETDTWNLAKRSQKRKDNFDIVKLTLELMKIEEAVVNIERLNREYEGIWMKK
jgi:hypothetical protein